MPPNYATHQPPVTPQETLPSQHANIGGFGLEGLVFIVTAITLSVKVTNHINTATGEIRQDIALNRARLQSVEDKLSDLTNPPDYGPTQYRPHSARKWQRSD